MLKKLLLKIIVGTGYDVSMFIPKMFYLNSGVNDNYSTVLCQIMIPFWHSNESAFRGHYNQILNII